MIAKEPVRVILVNYRSVDDIRRHLRSGLLEDCDVIIVDNDSDPQDVQKIASAHGARYLLSDRNGGFAAGVNSAVTASKDARGPWLLLNPDVTLQPDTVDGLRARIEAGATGVAPLMYKPNAELQVGIAGMRPTLRSVVCYFLGLAHVLPKLRGVVLTRRQSISGGRVDWLSMGCLMLTNDAFAKFGPVPEDEIVYGEDVAWGSRASRAGAELVLACDLRVAHAVGASGGGDAWWGAFKRLLVRELGPVRGRLACSLASAGLLARAFVRGVISLLLRPRPPHR